MTAPCARVHGLADVREQQRAEERLDFVLEVAGHGRAPGARRAARERDPARGDDRRRARLPAIGAGLRGARDHRPPKGISSAVNCRVVPARGVRVSWARHQPSDALLDDRPVRHIGQPPAMSPSVPTRLGAVAGTGARLDGAIDLRDISTPTVGCGAAAGARAASRRRGGPRARSATSSSRSSRASSAVRIPRSRSGKQSRPAHERALMQQHPIRIGLPRALFAEQLRLLRLADGESARHGLGLAAAPERADGGGRVVFQRLGVEARRRAGRRPRKYSS